MLFGAETPEGAEAAHAALNLSENGDLVEAAAHLFSASATPRRLGRSDHRGEPDSGTGLGEAINDRLRRAAAER